MVRSSIHGHSLFTVADETDFFTHLQRHSEHVVPVVGAGLGRPAGEPSFRQLNEGMAAKADPGWLASKPGIDLDNFEVAEGLAADFGEAEVRRWACEVVAGYTDLHPTPALKALSHVRSRLIVTTNYGLAIERAADACGVPVQSVTARDFPVALRDRDCLVVMHLHGRQDNPDSIVLTDASYQRALADEGIRQFVRDIALRHKLVFLGQRLAREEKHIIEHISWAVGAGLSPWGPHMLVTSSSDPDDPVRLADKDRVESDARVAVLDARDPHHEFMATQQTISAVIPPALSEHTSMAQPLDEKLLEPYYVPMPVAEEAEVNTPGGRGAYMARTWQSGVLNLADVAARHPRVLLVAPGGYGKSVEVVHTARHSPFPALYAKLSGFAPTPQGARAEAAFVRNMRHASSVSIDCPAPLLTLDNLRTGSYLFVVDALDEVPPDVAESVAEQLSVVAAAYPQHRWLVATRPVIAAESLRGFQSWSPFPGPAWLAVYAEGRNVPAAQLEEVLARSPRLAEVAEIPAYGAAIVNFTRADKPLPDLPVEIIWMLNDEREQADEPSYLAPRQQVRAWLDRLALRQQLTATTETTHADLAGSSIAQDLDQVGNSDELLTSLAVRALVTSAAGTVRFPTTLTQEARAARVLRDADDEVGLQLLRDHVLITLDAAGPDGSPVTRVRPNWRSVLDLLLPLLDDRWWTEIRGFDPLLTARAMVAVDDPAGRLEAASRIWEHYATRSLTLDSGPGGRSTMSDFEAFQRLTTPAASQPLDTAIRDAFVSGNHADRSNALLACAFVLDPGEAAAAIVSAVGDTHPVVRHYAAQAAAYLQRSADDGATQFAVMRTTLIEKAKEEADRDLAASMLTCALMHTPVPDLLDFAASLTYPLAGTAATIVLDRVPIDDVLAHLRELGTLANPVGEELLRRLDTFAHGVTLNARQTATLSMLTSQDRDLRLGNSGLRAAARAEPISYVMGQLIHSAGWDEYTPHELLNGWTGDQREKLADVLRAGPAGWDVYGVTPTQVDSSRVSQLRSVIERIAAYERTAPAAGAERTTQTTTSHHTPGAAADGDVAERFNMAVQTGALDKLAAGGKDPATLRTLLDAAAEDITIPKDSWVACLAVLARTHHQRLADWLLRHAQAQHVGDALALIATVSPDDVAAVLPAVPGPWTEPFTEAACAVLEPDDEVKHAVINAAALIADRGDHSVLRRWSARHGSPRWLLPFLVVAGDADAETALLIDVARHPGTFKNRADGIFVNWVAGIRHASSAQTLLDAVRSLLRRDVPRSDVAPLLDALRRIIGPLALTSIAELVDDDTIPHHPYLYYSWVETADALAESDARRGLPAALDGLVRAVVPLRN